MTKQIAYHQELTSRAEKLDSLKEIKYRGPLEEGLEVLQKASGGSDKTTEVDLTAAPPDMDAPEGSVPPSTKTSSSKSPSVETSPPEPSPTAASPSKPPSTETSAPEPPSIQPNSIEAKAVIAVATALENGVGLDTDFKNISPTLRPIFESAKLVGEAAAKVSPAIGAVGYKKLLGRNQEKKSMIEHVEQVQNLMASAMNAPKGMTKQEIDSKFIDPVFGKEAKVGAETVGKSTGALGQFRSFVISQREKVTQAEELTNAESNKTIKANDEKYVAQLKAEQQILEDTWVGLYRGAQAFSHSLGVRRNPADPEHLVRMRLDIHSIKAKNTDSQAEKAAVKERRETLDKFRTDELKKWYKAGAPNTDNFDWSPLPSLDEPDGSPPPSSPPGPSSSPGPSSPPSGPTNGPSTPSGPTSNPPTPSSSPAPSGTAQQPSTPPSDSAPSSTTGQPPTRPERTPLDGEALNYAEKIGFETTKEYTFEDFKKDLKKYVPRPNVSNRDKVVVDKVNKEFKTNAILFDEAFIDSDEFKNTYLRALGWQGLKEIVENKKGYAYGVKKENSYIVSVPPYLSTTRARYETILHELGHVIDFTYFKQLSENDPNLAQALILEHNKYLDQVNKSLKDKRPKKEIRDLLYGDTGFRRSEEKEEKGFEPIGLTPGEQEWYKDFKEWKAERIKDVLRRREMSDEPSTKKLGIVEQYFEALADGFTRFLEKWGKFTGSGKEKVTESEAITKWIDTLYGVQPKEETNKQTTAPVTDEKAPAPVNTDSEANLENVTVEFGGRKNVNIVTEMAHIQNTIEALEKLRKDCQ